MPNKMIRHEVICPYCEGTKRALNFFDPLEMQLPNKYAIDRTERAPSGREMYEYKCEECHDGTKVFYELIK